MALVSVNATETGWHSDIPLQTALQALPARAPVIIMIHGYRFSPWVVADDPHRHIMSLHPRRDCWKAVSWPRHLHLHRTTAKLAIGLGWHARGNLRDVASHAFDIGGTLAGMIHQIKDMRPDLQVHILAHSLGARVALTAVAELAPAAVRRVVLLSGAEYRGLARAAMESPGGRGTEVVNVTSGENALFDVLFRLAVPAPTLTDWPISAGFGDLAGWTDLRVDCPDALRALKGLGYPTRPPTTRICHWSTYLRPGLFRLYRNLCDPARPDPLPHLAAALARTAARLEAGGPAPRLSPL